MFFDAILVLIGTMRTPEDQRIIPIKDHPPIAAPAPAEAASAPVSTIPAIVIQQEPSSTDTNSNADKEQSDDSNTGYTQ